MDSSGRLDKGRQMLGYRRLTLRGYRSGSFRRRRNTRRPAGEESGGENIIFGPSISMFGDVSPSGLRSVAQQELVIVDLTTLSSSLCFWRRSP